MVKEKVTKSKSEKRKMEKNNLRKKNQKILMITVIIIGLSIGIFYIISLGGSDIDESFTPVSDSNEISDTQISIPLSSLSSSAKYYKYESEGVDVNYFAVLSNDDQVHVAVDACDVCYHAKEGYRQIGNVMECINCGLTFPIEDIGNKNTGGGCWPSFIPISIVDDNVLIEKTDLDSKRFMFE